MKIKGFIKLVIFNNFQAQKVNQLVIFNLFFQIQNRVKVNYFSIVNSLRIFYNWSRNSKIKKWLR